LRTAAEWPSEAHDKTSSASQRHNSRRRSAARARLNCTTANRSATVRHIICKVRLYFRQDCSFTRPRDSIMPPTRHVLLLAATALCACAPDAVTGEGKTATSTVQATVGSSLSVSLSGPSVVSQSTMGGLFVANASGGVEPYVYLWHAFGGGVAITQTQVAETSDYYGSLRFSSSGVGGALINVDVTVTDAEGNSASAYTTAISASPGPGSIPDCALNPRLPKCRPTCILDPNDPSCSAGPK
jgi:hypothetical protein